MMIKAGVARSLEAGVISKYILGDERPMPMLPAVP